MDLRYEDFRRCATLAREARRLRDTLESIRAMMESISPRCQDGPRSTASLPDDRIAVGIDCTDEQVREGQERIAAYLEHVGYIMAAIETVPDLDQRAVLRMYYVDGCTWAEVAARMFFSEYWCRVLSHKGLAFLGIDQKELLEVAPPPGVL